MMKKNVKIIGLVFLIIIGMVYFLRNLSFTGFNTYPRKISNEFLEKTYGKKFTLMNTAFYKENGYYIWEMQYKDENDLEFSEYYFHPMEVSEGGIYLFFDKGYVEYRFNDYYWQAEAENKFGDQFNLENFRTGVSYATPMYRFAVSDENDIKEAADIITVTLNHILKNVEQLPDYAIGAYDIEYMGKRICLIRIDSEMREFVEKDYDEIFQFIYDEIYNSFTEVK